MSAGSRSIWCLRGGSEERASILPNADALYNSATVPHATRWSLPLPSFADTIAYRDEVLERLIEQGEGRPCRCLFRGPCACATS